MGRKAKLEVGSHDWLLNYMREKTAKMVALAEMKNADYAGASPDAFGNFTAVEKLKFATTEQGFFTRMTDKFLRIHTFTLRGNLKVKSESVEDTLLDLANYSLLFAAYLKAKHG